jgi:hypothetical protein
MQPPVAQQHPQLVLYGLHAVRTDSVTEAQRRRRPREVNSREPDPEQQLFAVSGTQCPVDGEAHDRRDEGLAERMDDQQRTRERVPLRGQMT